MLSHAKHTMPAASCVVHPVAVCLPEKTLSLHTLTRSLHTHTHTLPCFTHFSNAAQTTTNDVLLCK